jgi:tetrahydromethanopterin S-methyltransferase subunit E
MVIVVICLAFLAGAIWFSRQADDRLVRGLKTASMATLVAFVLLTITGLVPDVAFEGGATFSGTFHNDFGTVQSTVSDDNVGAFTGPLLFDVMEHITLVVPGLALLICFLVWHFGKRVVEDQVVRRSVLSLLFLTGFWVLALGSVGVYITKILTYPYTR